MVATTTPCGCSPCIDEGYEGPSAAVSGKRSYSWISGAPEEDENAMLFVGRASSHDLGRAGTLALRGDLSAVFSEESSELAAAIHPKRYSLHTLS